jgi:hypothetical protein
LGQDRVVSLVTALEPLPDELAVASLILRRSPDGWALVRGSLLVAPHHAGEANWFDWQVRHGIRPLIQPDPPGPQYLVEAEDYLAGRAVMSLDEADGWLQRLIEGGVGSPVGPLPDFGGSLHHPVAPLRVSAHMDTPGSTFVSSGVRPAVGYLLAMGEENPGEAEAPVDGWHAVHGMTWKGEGGTWINTPLSLGVPIMLNEPCPRGLFVGRLGRTAWINNLRGSEGLSTFECSLGLEPERIDIADLAIAFEEWVGDELVHAQQVHLEDWDVDAVRGAAAVDVHLPTLGPAIRRTVRLYDRSGAFLDGSGDRFYIAEKITISVGIIGSDAPAAVVTAGEETPQPDLVEMSEAIDRVKRQHHDLRTSGAAATLIPSGPAVRAHLQAVLAQARGRIQIVDRYFGNDPADWAMLPSGIAIEVLVSAGTPPPAPIAGVDVRRLRGAPPPFHGRAYLWEDGGVAVDASPNGFGHSPVLVTRLDPELAAHWQLIFAGWWAAASPV